MSWSLSNECWKCKKEPECHDLTILYTALSIIHGPGVKMGWHKGGGALTMKCQNFESKDTVIGEK